MFKASMKWLKYISLSLFLPLVFIFLAVNFNWLGRPLDTGHNLEGSRIVESQKEKGIYFGDLHVHSSYSMDAAFLNLPILGGEGSHPVSEACNYARFCSNLDFFSISDHAELLSSRDWKETITSIQQCSRSLDPDEEKDMVPFIGWEWTQTSLDSNDHYGHKNIIIRGVKNEDIPQRPIAAGRQSDYYQFLNFMGGNSLALLSIIDFKNRQDYFDLKYKLDIAKNLKDCPSEKHTKELQSDCYEIAENPKELFAKLGEWNLDFLVIPHGSSWGNVTPPMTDWTNQISEGFHDNELQKLVEVYSGHGNSEEYRNWREFMEISPGNFICPKPSENYIPECFQAGEVIKERCRVSAGSEKECDARAKEAINNYVALNPFGLLTIPGLDGKEWVDSGQCKDCFMPAFSYRPQMSVQYALALGDFNKNPPGRFKFGMIGSSDNHSSRPGNGYKELERRFNTESRISSDSSLSIDFAEFLGNPEYKLPRSKGLVDTENQKTLPSQSERATSYLYSGGLVAIHAEKRSMNSLWEGMNSREVYATSGDRILLWFDLINHPEGKKSMGSEAAISSNPSFRAKAIGAQIQNPGCDFSLYENIKRDDLVQICNGECFNPSDVRKKISRIEIIRIRPQIYKGEPIENLIEDPWRIYSCEESPEGCEITFSDDEFKDQNREITYYVRAIQEPSMAINGRASICIERDGEGKCIKVEMCGDPSLGEDCLSNTEERAWSSPIFLRPKLF
tara:strand:- start:1076 stop:3277 length:2202 start_codon:yes stop_codon:yes gene_type:complete